MHSGLIDSHLAAAAWVRDQVNITAAERTQAIKETTNAVKAAKTISGAGQQQYMQPKIDLINNYLFGTDQYPDTVGKLLCLLYNYRMPRAQHFRHQPREDGVAFVQTGRRG